MKKTTALFLFLFQIILISSVFAQSPAITNGLNYLTSVQNRDGSWGSATSGAEILPSTVSVIETLQLLNQTNTPSYPNSLSWLQSQGLETTDYLSERIYALSAAGTDSALLLSYIDSVTGAWGGEADFEVNNLDTVWALQALQKITYSDQTVMNNALSYLISTQNSDGGWGFSQGDDSNVYMTAIVSSTLQQFPQTTSIATALNTAMGYFLAHQNADGGFGSSPSTVFETSLAYLGLVGMTTDGTVLGNAINFLTLAQASDGSWNDDPYATALALRAVNKAVSLPPQPITGAVTGKAVAAATNQPLSGVSIILQSDPTLNTVSDATGSFKLSNIPPGAQTVALSLSGFTPATASANVTAGSIIDLGTVPLSSNPTSGIVKGTITDAASGQPLGSVAITITGSFSGSTTTGADGSFIFAAVAPGTVTITATVTGYYSATGTGTVASGGTLFFSPELSTQPSSTANGNLTGTVFDSSTLRPIQGAVISVTGGPAITADANGLFVAANITPAAYQVTVSAGGYMSQIYQVMIPSGVTTDMRTIYLVPTFQTTTVTGTITDAATGKPIAGAVVLLAGTSISAITDSSGTYTVGGITFFQFVLKASAGGYDSNSYSVTTTGFGAFTVNFSLRLSQVSNLSIESLSTDAQSYQAYSDIVITATVVNGGTNTVQAALVAQLRDAQTNTLSVISPYTPLLNFGPSSSGPVSLIGNTDKFPPGTYTIVLQAIDPVSGNALAEASSTFTILQTIGISDVRVLLSPLFSSVGSTETVSLPVTFSNRSNVAVQLTIQRAMTSPSGVMISNGSTAYSLAPEDTAPSITLAVFPYTFNESGDHPAQVTVLNGSDLLGTASNSISIAPATTKIVPSMTLTPTVVTPDGDQQIRINIHLQGE